MRTRYQGIPASDGIAVAPLFILEASAPAVEERHDVSVTAEQSRLQAAIEQTKAELQTLFETAKEKMGAENAQIFTAHLQILEDPEFAGAIANTIDAQSVNAEFAVTTVANQLVAVFEQMEDEYLRQRASDIKDVSQRLLSHVQGVSRTSLAELQSPVVLAAEDLTPSDTVVLDKNLVKAFITDVGGKTSHSAIMARSLGIPAVVGLGPITHSLVSGTTVMVNGFTGEVIVDPTPDEQAEFAASIERHAAAEEQLKALVNEPSVTTDGRQVEVGGNIGSPQDLAAVLENGGEGVGLFRSEFLYMNRTAAPTEEEQFEAYRQVAAGLNGRPVVIRTLDVGGDKEIPYLDLPAERNPFLGYRAIRVCLDRTELFQTQLRAILRASHYGNIKMMFPMISNITEIRRAKQVLEEVKADLRRNAIPFDEHLEVGIMIEIPAAAVAADLLAKEVDFFSIGTNDLIQYTMACDRMNEQISHLYQPYHPAILRLVKWVIDGAHRHGKWVGMCGEMAGDLTATPILLGLGLDEFSMSAKSILKVRQAIRNLSYEQAQKLAETALAEESEEAVLALVEAWHTKQ
ncbi:phosphoenolpyruvate--protein phosphotransferase [Alicyclobacillus cycloheptanicus]|uniref:Phosphoenolpyruvate-protein phosphotransferase n=1 Tax=Alicyclobacillus cycloheptanicus TaxID=1457 RepID=A0ABT9XGQ7_9BACL|nr:phosphoenolpyruvate--protein phosphotransferase [Alicyclobacillus cycloheptanicus]MDQ0189488.1 phosphotransferase system enzyme I (PtsI) [Alicyclobacillus cycloheptanicus]WDM01553.1 phosphoenolpyruvate--protein phosphotransferase [Alicyclobacillus cycloheptanicus]